MNQATDAIQAAIYEAPLTIALGPQWSAIAAGYAVLWFGRVYLTPAGQRYLDNQDCTHEPNHS